VESEECGLTDGRENRCVRVGCGAVHLPALKATPLSVPAPPVSEIKRPPPMGSVPFFPEPQIGSWTWANTDGFVITYSLIGRGRRIQPRLCPLCGWTLY